MRSIHERPYPKQAVLPLREPALATGDMALDRAMTLAYIGLGANLGDASATLKQAAQELASDPAVASMVLSPLYRSAAIDSDGPDYTNAVAWLRTCLTAHGLLALLQHVEQRYGRQRPYRNAPRTLDLDLLLFGEQLIDEPDLIVPHPRLHQRAFVLAPLDDLAPDLRLAQGSVANLLAGCADQRLQRLD